MNKLLTKLQNIMDELNNGNNNDNNGLYQKAEKLINRIEKKIEEIEKKINNDDIDCALVGTINDKMDKYQILDRLIHNNSLLDDENTNIDSSLNIYFESKKLEKQYLKHTNAMHVI